MTGPAAEWTATLRVELAEAAVAGWVEDALRPEAAREVPRARAEVRRSGAATIELTITARDSGALRAALNTYLGWIHLALATVRSATAGGPAP